MPKVSIIIPVYNAEKALRKCIDSILNQEYKDFELLL
ncbi:MAG: glycosyltransferase, partial [Oribacterium sp.]|nr:glycosyltransferase [Oribacterium sp.]